VGQVVGAGEQLVIEMVTMVVEVEEEEEEEEKKNDPDMDRLKCGSKDRRKLQSYHQTAMMMHLKVLRTVTTTTTTTTMTNLAKEFEPLEPRLDMSYLLLVVAIEDCHRAHITPSLQPLRGRRKGSGGTLAV